MLKWLNKRENISVFELLVHPSNQFDFIKIKQSIIFTWEAKQFALKYSQILFTYDLCISYHLIKNYRTSSHHPPKFPSVVSPVPEILRSVKKYIDKLGKQICECLPSIRYYCSKLWTEQFIIRDKSLWWKAA